MTPVRDAFRAQGQACAALGSPFMAGLMALLAERLDTGPVAQRVLNWDGDPSPGADSVPLRLAGAFHALKLDGRALGDVYPPHKVSDAVLWDALSLAMDDHQAHILTWLQQPPQTNEVRRAGAIIAALSMVAARYNQPVELLELGCSGGLNLCADKFQLTLPGVVLGSAPSVVSLAPEWTGPVPKTPLPPVIARRGVDLSPVDPSSAVGRQRLLAYLWPDQAKRMARTDAAIDVARHTEIDIQKGDAGDWTAAVLSTPAPDRLRVLFHTVAWQYFLPASQARAQHAMETTASPLVRFAMEGDGGVGAALTLTHYPSGERHQLGRADFHGRWINWQG